MKRRSEMLQGKYALLESHADPKTGAGVFSGRKSDGTLVALFFNPTATKDFFEVEISSHERVALATILAERMEEEARRRNAPHDLKPGDIFHVSRGSSFRVNSFWRVLGSPTPNSIEAEELPVKVTQGAIEHGLVEPDFDAPLPEEPNRATFKITMDSGKALWFTPGDRWKYERGRLWNGKPWMNNQD